MWQRLAVFVLLLAVLSSCGCERQPVDAAGAGEDVGEHGETSLDYQNQSEDSGLIFKSELLGITVELPSLWTELVRIYDEEDSVRIDVIEGWDPLDDHNGYIASIFRFEREVWEVNTDELAENNTEEFPRKLFGSGDVSVMAEKDDTVIILWLQGGGVNYSTNTVPGFKIYSAIWQGLNDGDYRVSIW